VDASRARRRNNDWKMRALTGKGVMTPTADSYNEPFSRLSVLMSIVDIPKDFDLNPNSPTSSPLAQPALAGLDSDSMMLRTVNPYATTSKRMGSRQGKGLRARPKSTVSTTSAALSHNNNNGNNRNNNAQRVKTVRTVANEAIQELVVELKFKKEELAGRNALRLAVEEETLEYLRRIEHVLALLQ